MIPSVPPPLPKPPEQKLVTIYLDNSAYAPRRGFVASFADRHGTVEEHLAPLLAEGWRVAGLHGFGGNSEGLSARGWMVAVLERSAA